MSTDRRTFLKLSAAAGGALALTGSSAAPLVAATARANPSRERDTGKASAPLNILILGGTGFTGPEHYPVLLEALRARGYDGERLEAICRGNLLRVFESALPAG